MAFVAAFLAIKEFFVAYAFAIAVVTTTISIVRQQQLSRRMRAAQDAAKGTTIPIEGEVAAIPVVYGRALVGGIRVYHKTANNYFHAEPTGSLGDPNNGYIKQFLGGKPKIITAAVPNQQIPVMVVLNSDDGPVQATDPQTGLPLYTTGTIPAVEVQTGTSLTEDREGSKNEFLFMQQVISLGAIQDVADILIEPNRFYNNPDFRVGLRANIFLKGGILDKTIARNFSERSNAFFTNMSYASMCFKINRNEPAQYQGVPQVQFLVKGRSLKDIELFNGVYIVSTSEFFSNNPARVLLDYLTSPLYGLALSTDQIDLESFYKVKQICDTVVATNVVAYGNIWIPASSELYLQPVEEKNNWHPFLNENAVWEYRAGPSGDANKELVDSIDKTFYIYLETGVYTFYITADDNFILTVNDVLIGQQSSGNPYTSLFNYNVTVSTGLQKIRIQANNSGGGPAGIALTVDDNSLEKVNRFNLKNPLYATIRPTLPLFECNVVISPESSIRDNIETILETMNGAELVWSDGKYKLICYYPANEAAIFQGLSAEEIAQRQITDDLLIRDSFSMKWPNASEKLNYCTVKFANEALNFKDDSVSWPSKTPANPANVVYSTMLAEDNGVRLEADFYEKGIVDFHHALAKAEERVRKSRSTVIYEFKVPFKGFIYEPGDILRLQSTLFDVGISQNEYIQVQEVNVEGDFTIAVKAARFDINTLAWNVADDVYSPRLPSTGNKVFQKPFNIAVSGTSITWEDASNSRAIGYKVYYWDGGSAFIADRLIDKTAYKYFTAYLTQTPIYFIKLTEITKVFYGPIANQIAYGLYTRGSNIDLVAIINSYLSNATINGDFVNNTNTQFLTNLYRRVLNREPDLDGLNWWVTNIGSISRAQIFLNFIDNAYELGLYFTEFGSVNSKEATAPNLEGILAFVVKGFDSNGNETAFSDLTQLYEVDGRFSNANYVVIEGQNVITQSNTNVKNIVELTANLFRSGIIDNTNATYKWYIAPFAVADQLDANHPLVVSNDISFKTLSGAAATVPLDSFSNAKTIVIKETAVTDLEVFKVEVETETNTIYSAYVTVYDTSDPYELTLISTAGDKFQNSTGSTFVYPIVFDGSAVITDTTNWTFDYEFYDQTGAKGAFVDSSFAVRNIFSNSSTTFTVDAPLTLPVNAVVKVISIAGVIRYYEVAAVINNTTITIDISPETQTFASNIAPGNDAFANGSLFVCQGTTTTGVVTKTGGTLADTPNGTHFTNSRITVTGDDIDGKGTITCKAMRP